ncbi:YhgE/Pip domain-containing protein [Paenibacillus sp. F6_3S_P_1C]|uniref:YhgE/Pip domain-containing protein n=1 Tax=Paenibacillus vandeheii TaxID=3035917 RepID=A0ABT8JGT5_9BACL|nr:YhgE/Pip domain-containing protein [Paenibacillus vandeheii]MDN4604272.1 YhgE/Pip domain-containing protein [Paenibacillus vandeheii]
MNAFKMEWKNIFTNRILLGTLVVLMFVPIMYSGIFLSSAWDPYGRTAELPVAVVNEDTATNYGDKTLNLGEELINQLKDNDSLQWHFVDQTKAKQGLEDGDYYMVITIPKNFSANASSVLDQKPTAMTMNYVINPGRNYFASVVSSQAAASVKEMVASNITEVYTKTLFDQIGSIGEGMQEAADGSGKIQDGIGNAKDGNLQLKAGLQKLTDSTLTFSDGSQQMVVALNSAQTGVAQLHEGARKLDQGISAYTVGVDTLYTGSQKFVEGANQLNAETTKLVTGAQSLATGAEQMVPGLQSLSNGSISALGGSTALTQGLNEMNGAVSRLTDDNKGVPALTQGQENLHSGIVVLQTGADSLQKGLSQLSSSIPSEDQTQQLSQGLQQIQDGMNQLADQIGSGTDLTNSFNVIQKNMSSIQLALTALSTQQQSNGKSTLSVIQKTSGFQALTNAQQQELVNALDEELTKQAEQQIVQLQTISSALSEMEKAMNIELLPAVKEIGTLSTEIQQLNGAVNRVNPTAVLAISTYSTLDTAINEKLLPGSAKLNQGLADALKGSDGLVSAMKQLNQQIPVLAQSTNQLFEGSQELTDGLTSLSSGSQQMVVAAGQFGPGADQFSTGVKRYSQGLEQLSVGAQQMGGGLNQLAAESGELSKGSAAITQGLSSLASNFPNLVTGAEKLSGGAEQLHDGSSSLLQGSNDLNDGIVQLESGTDELNTKLSDGAKQIEDVSLKDANAEMIAKPINLEKQEYSSVPNYGHALAPYVLILGLFVGAIAFNLVFPLTSPAGKKASGFSWWLGKFSVGALQATLAALIMVIIMVLGMDLQVDNLLQFVVLAITASITFMFFVMLLNVAFGNAGRLLAMVILVIQLGASGGMFPMELTNKFFNALHWLLPMSYAVEGFRSALTSSMSAGQFGSSMMGLIGFMILFNVLLLSVMVVKSRKNASFSNHNDAGSLSI